MAHTEQVGARWLAHEQPVPDSIAATVAVADEPPVYAPKGGPLIERLDAASLAALASVASETVAELIERVTAVNV